MRSARASISQASDHIQLLGKSVIDRLSDVHVMFGGVNFNIRRDLCNRRAGRIDTVERLVGARRDDYKGRYDKEKMHA
jgi:hypothetical protein